MTNLAAAIEALRAHVLQDDRLLRLSTPFGDDVLVAESLVGTESVSGGGFALTITASSLDAFLDLDAAIGAPVLVELLTAQSRSALRPLHGHVTGFRRIGADGGLGRYELTIEPWLAFAKQRSDSFIFQDMSVFDIVESLFADYQGAACLVPAWRWEIADRAIYPRRSLTTQYRESDFDFFERLLIEEGLYYWFEHTGDRTTEPFGSHTLVIADHNEAFKPGTQSRVRFHRAHASEADDTIQTFDGRARWETNALAIATWDYRTLAKRPISVASENIARDRQALEDRDFLGAYAYEDVTQGERRARLRQEALEARNARWSGAGVARSLAPGTRFDLDSHADADAGPYLVLAVAHEAHNNFRADGGSAPRAGEDAGEDYLYRNRFVAQSADAPVRLSDCVAESFGDGLLADAPRWASATAQKPTIAGVQTAVVVGSGAPVETDRDHRIKLQCHWVRGASSHSRLDHGSGENNAPGDASAGTWVRVAAAQAGSNWGAAFIPRVGQEVVVAFLDGDIDRPIVTGVVYNGQGARDAQSNSVASGAGPATGNAPAWFAGEGGAYAHAAVLTGFKTQSLATSASGIGGYNQLVFDASAGQARVGLSTTQANSRLVLGHIRHQSDNRRLADRGHGFELATDGAGALRAGRGMLLSADKVESTQLEGEAAIGVLSEAESLAESLAKAAGQVLPAAAQVGGQQAKAPAVESRTALIASLRAVSRGDLINTSEDGKEILEQYFVLLGEGDVPLRNYHYDLYRNGELHTRAASLSNGETVAIEGDAELRLVAWTHRGGSRS